MQKENILQNFYSIQLFLTEKITFVPWFIPKNGCDALATVAKGICTLFLEELIARP